MKTIQKIVMSNFKRFDAFELDCDPTMNILIGDNEAGKSSILLALDLALSGSRSKVESIGIESLIHKPAVEAFLKGAKRPEDLPTMFVEVYLSDQQKHELHGRCNSKHDNTDGLRFSCEPSSEYGKEIAQILQDDHPNFPFEFYAIKFATFANEPYGAYRKFLRHLLIDSSQINSDYAAREYTRALYHANASARERGGHENQYRRSKETFWTEHLSTLNGKIEDFKFWLRSSPKSNLEGDLVITEGGIAIESKGKGRQSLIKIEFALRKKDAEHAIDALLLEEPENHLSHGNMRRLIERISGSDSKQVFVATHSSLVCSRLDLRKAVLLDGVSRPVTLKELPETTANFFCKAPDNNALEFAMSKRVILVEGDAEFILISALYATHSKSTLESDGVHVISVGGTSFKRYLDLAKLLKIRTAVIRDNDGDYEKHCVANYEGYLGENARVFADEDSDRSTFEICLYQDNVAACDELFGAGRRTLTTQEYMLGNKAEAALALLDKKGATLVAPGYLQEAIAWIRG